jgi:hypothetical protein
LKEFREFRNALATKIYDVLWRDKNNSLFSKETRATLIHGRRMRIPFILVKKCEILRKSGRLPLTKD